MKFSSSATKQSGRRQLDAVLASEVVEELPKRNKKPLWFGILTGAFVGAIALVLLWQDALPGLALRKPNLERESVPQVPPAATAQISQLPEETPEIVEPDVSVALTEIKQITKTQTPEKLIRAANDIYGNPGASWSPDSTALLFARASGRTDYVAQQTGVVPLNLWSYVTKTAQGNQLSLSGALGWDGSWGSVRFSSDSASVLYYELFSTSEQTVNGPRILSSNQDGFYSVSLASSQKARLNVPSESRILTQLEDKAFPSTDGKRVLFVTQSGEYIWQEGDGQHSLGIGIDERNGKKYFRYSLPTWSPDGSQIAFTRQLDNDPASAANVAIYVLAVNADARLDQARQVGTATIPENHLVFEDIDIDWSPDGKSFWVGSHHTLFTVDGQNAQQIETGENVRPFAWSPDGSKVLALVERGTTAEHFQIIDLTNGNAQDLPQEAKQAVWFSNNSVLIRAAAGLNLFELEQQKITSLISHTITDFSLAPNHIDLAWVAEGELWIAKIQ